MLNWPARLWLPKCLTILITCLFFNLSAVADDDSDYAGLIIKSAKYDIKKQHLKVKLKLKGKKPFLIELSDTVSGEILLNKTTRNDSLELKLKNLSGSSIPCAVTVTMNSFSQTRAVKHAPDNCSGHQNNSQPGMKVSDIQIKEAKYKDNRLKVKGKIKGGRGQSVKLFDDLTGLLLSDQNLSRDSDRFSFKISGLTPVPCRIRVEAGQVSASTDVKHAPADCSTPPPPGNQPPVCSITKPVENPVTISLGEMIDFAGQASDPEGGALTFEWDFNGGADIRPTVMVPGNITFDVNNGSFLVHFIVTDDQGARCTASKTVIVGTQNPNIPTQRVPEQPAPGSYDAGDGQHVVLPANDLGMHCADLGSYPFNILPPFNTINAHVIRKGTTGANKPLILDTRSVTLKYSAASNANDPVGPGSINSTSRNYPIDSLLADAIIKKSDFWDDFQNTGQSVASLLFPGLNPAFDEGLLTLDNLDQGHGRYMPGIDAPYMTNTPQEFSKFITDMGWHTAQGIPLTSVDDQGRLNSYPILRIQAVDNTNGTTLATTDVVAPVSAEVDCRDCHSAGQVGADSTARSNGPQFLTAASSDRLDVEVAAKKNILMLHDFKHGTDFIAQDQPVLCAGCHRSNALATVGGPAGQAGLDSMSKVMHGFHGRLQTDAQGALLRDFQGEPLLIDPQNRNGTVSLIPFGENVPMEENCFLCHPGKITQCFRGAMFTAGQTCDSCHGDMLAMGGEFTRQDGSVREPWAEEPKCGSCHSGIGSDAVANLAYDPADPSAEPLAAKTLRFAENDQTLYRNSLDDHAKLGCESCHGSPHAIWPNRNPDANDNVTAMQLQGHTGTLTECTSCHEANSFPNGTLSGPHGMHPVNDADWNDEDVHGHFAENKNNGDSCAVCHGDDHLGTRLSTVPVDRVYKDRKGKTLVSLQAGETVSCDLCHSLRKSFGD